MDIRSSHESVTTPDGAMPVYIAEPTAAGRRPAVIVIMEAFGLNAHIEDVTRRIAAEGYVALAPDIYWRSLPENKVGYDELPKAIGLMQKVNDGKAVQDISSAIDALAKRPNVNAAKIGVTGFCMGGRLSFLARGRAAGSDRGGGAVLRRWHRRAPAARPTRSARRSTCSSARRTRSSRSIR